MMIKKVFYKNKLNRRKGVFRYFFRTFFLLFLNLGLNPSLLAAPIAKNARKQVYVKAVEAATATISYHAKQQKWRDYQVKLNVFIPNEIAENVACETPLQVSLPADNRNNLLRLRYNMRCEGTNGWQIAVTVKPDIYLPVLVAKKNLERGSRLAASDIELKKHNISSMNSGYITQLDDALGLIIKRKVRSFLPLTHSVLEQPILVERGQRILMIAEQQGISARTLGEAMKKGRRGDIIKVKNLSSQKIVMAEVVEAGVVRTLTVSLDEVTGER